jgi:hypothetical protein
MCDGRWAMGDVGQGKAYENNLTTRSTAMASGSINSALHRSSAIVVVALARYIDQCSMSS